MTCMCLVVLRRRLLLLYVSYEVELLFSGSAQGRGPSSIAGLDPMSPRIHHREPPSSEIQQMPAHQTYRGNRGAVLDKRISRRLYARESENFAVVRLSSPYDSWPKDVFR